MLRTFLTFSVLSLVSLSMAIVAPAQQPRSFHCSGSGCFVPANIGTADGGTFGLVLGDGSGLSQYSAEGLDFTIDGQQVGSGLNTHVGGNKSWTSGIVQNGKDRVVWPAKSNMTHVMSSDDGEIHFRYTGAYTLDLLTGMFGARAMFIVTGGTDRFAGAHGVVIVDVAVTGPPEEPIPFDYDFNGFIIFQD